MLVYHLLVQGEHSLKDFLDRAETQETFADYMEWFSTTESEPVPSRVVLMVRYIK